MFSQLWVWVPRSLSFGYSKASHRKVVHVGSSLELAPSQNRVRVSAIRIKASVPSPSSPGHSRGFPAQGCRASTLVAVSNWLSLSGALYPCAGGATGVARESTSSSKPKAEEKKEEGGIWGTIKNVIG